MFELISFSWLKIRLLWDFAGSSLVKTPCFYWGVPQVQLRGATGSIPGGGRSPGEEHGNPLKYSFLENPTGRGAWWATVHRVTKSQAWLQWLSTCACIDKWIPYQISFFWANQVIFSYYLIYNIKVLSSSYSLVMRMTKLWWSWQWDFLYELSDALFKNYSVWDPKINT